jgi:hypothetical protein
MNSKNTEQDTFPLDDAGNETLRGYKAGIWASTEHDLLFDVPNPNFAQGVADWWGLPVQIVMDSLNDGETCGRALVGLTALHRSPRKPELESYAKRKQES